MSAMPSVPAGDPASVPVLHVCVTCRAGQPLQDGVPVAGRLLHDRLADQLATEAVQPVRLRAAECLAACAQGCTAAISDGDAVPARWSYLLGRLTPDKADDLLVFARSYGASRTGTVMPSKRPASLSDTILGRMPAILGSVAR
jgi:predicted metal-binding protein